MQIVVGKNENTKYKYKFRENNYLPIASSQNPHISFIQKHLLFFLKVNTHWPYRTRCMFDLLQVLERKLEREMLTFGTNKLTAEV